MAHSFTATIEWTCLREIIALARKGPTNLTTAQKCEAIQHACYFGGCGAAWYAANSGPDEDDDTPNTGGLLSKLLDLFGTRGTYGDDLAGVPTKELCDRCEDALPVEGMESYGVLPWAQILSIVVPIIIELLKRLRTDDAPSE